MVQQRVIIAMQPHYPPHEIEPAVQQHWEQHNTFKVTEQPEKEKFYCLAMFPYPSGQLHMGHVRNYTLGDAIARYQRLQGKNVLYPIGWDAFGLPAENAAIKHRTDPATWTTANIASMKQQLKLLGFSYDWDREITTCDPNYTRWEQWLFIQLYQRGLAYKKTALVNWCPQDQTVLANEQVVEGCCWRCDTPVVQKALNQWFIKITAYADQLLNDLETLTEWPEQVKSMQRHWIGRSVGLEIDFTLHCHAERLTVYTTRPYTLPGVTYLAIAAAHPLVAPLIKTNPQIAAFVQQCQRLKTAEAALATLEKSGIDSGLQAIHPLSGQLIPIWITNFVISDYGSGAVMAVPAHDQRDYQFAVNYQLPIHCVIRPLTDDQTVPVLPYLEKGLLCHSGALNGLNFEQACQAITEQLQQQDQGRPVVHYRLRDWGVSRQRYWGAPIPMMTDATGNIKPVPVEQLPLCLPTIHHLDEHNNPLKQPDWINTHVEGHPVQRESDTFDTFLQSSWYYARYTCPTLTEGLLDPQATAYWLPVDHYIGGIEHATMHLIYFRFLHKVLRDLGLVHTDEPVKQLLCQGMVLAEAFYSVDPTGKRHWISPAEVTVHRDRSGAITQVVGHSGQTLISAGMCKMSKSKNNGIDPQQMVERYGADTVRLFMLFAAPPELTLEWQESGIEGAHRFLKRLWKLAYEQHHCGVITPLIFATLTESQQQLRRLLHQTILRVTDDIGRRQSFNTAIAAMMTLVKNLITAPTDTTQDQALRQEALLAVVVMLYPITPHISFTLWQLLGGEGDMESAPWPAVDHSALLNAPVTLAVQINGKLRATITVEANTDETTATTLAQQHPALQKYLQSGAIHRVIYRSGRLLNLVVD
jgi:leucyl-tRNA synthetase